MLQLLSGSLTHIGDGAIERQCFTGQWVIAIHRHFIFGDFQHGEKQKIFIVRSFGRTFELHADGHFFGEGAARFNFDQSVIIFAESVIGLQSNAAFIADAFAMQRFFNQWKNAIVAAVQVADLLLDSFQQFAARIEQFVTQRNNRAFGDFHFISFITSRISCACP